MIVSAAAVALGAVFLVSAVTKLARPSAWRGQGRDLGVPGVVIAALPTFELLLGAVLIGQWQRRWIALAALVTLMLFTSLLVLRIAQGRRPPCACFGGWSTTPIGWMHVLRNVGFMSVAVTLVVVG